MLDQKNAEVRESRCSNCARSLPVVQPPGPARPASGFGLLISARGKFDALLRAERDTWLDWPTTRSSRSSRSCSGRGSPRPRIRQTQRIGEAGAAMMGADQDVVAYAHVAEQCDVLSVRPTPKPAMRWRPQVSERAALEPDVAVGEAIEAAMESASVVLPEPFGPYQAADLAIADIETYAATMSRRWNGRRGGKRGGPRRRPTIPRRNGFPTP